MKFTRVFFVGILVVFLSQPLMAETVRVGLEPFPPLITEDGGGHSIDLLKAIEKGSDLRFDITIMPYSQAKDMLREGKLDLIGHTPKGKETQDFYAFAQDIDWSVITILDIYGLNKEGIAEGSFRSLEAYGAPEGNKEFFSEMFGIPVEKFVEGDLEQLLDYLKAGKIDAFMFDRASSMYTIKRLQVPNVHYRMLSDIGAGFGVRKDDQGAYLKNRMDSAIQSIDIQKALQGYYMFISQPSEGIVSVN